MKLKEFVKTKMFIIIVAVVCILLLMLIAYVTAHIVIKPAEAPIVPDNSLLTKIGNSGIIF